MHSFRLKRIARSEKMHKPDLYMLWYPLLAEFEHVRDIHYAAYQSLSLSFSLESGAQ